MPQPGKTNIQSYVQGPHEGAGFPHPVKLSSTGTLSASSSVILDSYRVPSTLTTDRLGVAIRICSVHIYMGSTGSTSGSTAWKIAKINPDNTVGPTVVSGSVTQGASQPLAEVLATVGGSGYALKPGEVIGLLVTAVPGTASSTIMLHVTAESYGVDG